MLRRALSELGRFLVSVTADPGHEEPGRRESGRQEKARHTPRAQSSAAFGQHASRLARNRRPGNPLLAGCIEFLGLDEIKREMGAAWQTKAVVIRNLIEETIERHLDADDTYLKREGDSYILCFATTDRGRTKARLQMITDDIRLSLAGFAPNDKLQVTHDVVEVECDDIDDGSVIDAIADSLNRVRVEAEKAARQWRQHLIRNASVSYKPVWSIRSNSVAIHRAVLDDETGRRAMQRLATLSSPDALRDIMFEIDGLILGRAATALHDLIGSGGQTQLIIPLHYNSVDAKTRLAQYQALCQNIPASYRRYLLFEVHDIPAGTPNVRVSELAAALNKYAHGVLREMEFTDNAVAAAFGIAGVVTRVPEQWGTKPDIAARLARFALGAQSAKLKSFLYDVDTEALANAAASANYDYLQGTAIAKPTRELQTYYKMKLELPA